MAEHFLQSHQLYLTPLSPLHLGTGEDYQPTEYTIEDGMMYVFDPSQAVLKPAQYEELMRVARSGKILAIQQYFKKHVVTFKECAYKVVGVSTALESEYKGKLGKIVQNEGNGKNVVNQLTIECTAVNPCSHQAYIPGSAFKGGVRTALLDSLTRKNLPEQKPNARQAIHHENQYLGAFASDVMRLLKTADFMPTNKVFTQIQYAVNHKKDKIIINGQVQMPKGVTRRCEAIQHGQYRSFQASCTMQHLLLVHQPDIKHPESKLPKENLLNINELAKAVNEYHQARWKKENQILEERNLVCPNWLKQTRQLLDNLKPQLDKGQIILMRLGKNGGAESKTLTNLAQIKIMQGKGNGATFESTTKTVWLAAQSERETHGLLPFGWVLVEINPDEENAKLKQWCESYTHLKNVEKANEQLEEQRLKLAQRKQEQQRWEQEQEAAEEAKKRADAEQAAILATMSPNERLIVIWQQKLKDFVFDSRNQQASNDFFQQFSQALLQAQEWGAEIQKNIAETFAWSKISKLQPSLFAGKREKEIKALLRQLRGE